MAEPPLLTGAVNETVAWFGEDVAAEGLVGAPGTDHGKVVVESIAPVDVPAELTAYALK